MDLHVVCFAQRVEPSIELQGYGGLDLPEPDDGMGSSSFALDLSPRKLVVPAWRKRRAEQVTAMFGVREWPAAVS